MGCDIHMFGEVRKGDRWVAFDHQTGTCYNGSLLQEFYDGRWYEFFGLLADGVRGYHGETQRGIPEDVSQEVSAEYLSWHGDAHSLSWLSVQDLLRIAQEPIHDGMALNIKEIVAQLKARAPYADDSDLRIVFWFDN